MLRFSGTMITIVKILTQMNPVTSYCQLSRFSGASPVNQKILNIFLLKVKIYCYGGTYMNIDVHLEEALPFCL